MTRRTRRALGGAAGLAAVLVGMWLLWPQALGGRTDYVVTHGVSMEPHFHTGDLALVRPAASYHVGDVAAYRSVSLHTTVLHRIVGQDGARFVFKGDNNSWIDVDHPASAQIVGRLVAHVPNGGRYLHAAQAPWLLLLIGLLVVGLGSRLSRRRGPAGGRHRGRASSSRRAPSARAVGAAGSVAAVLAAVAAVAGAATALLAVVPGTQVRQTAAPVLASGTFSYSGTAAPGVTYPGGSVRTGDPVYRGLVRQVTVRYTDRITAPADIPVRGSLRLDVSVETADGWRTGVTGSAAVPLSGGTATSEVVLDLPAIGTLLGRHAAEVGVGVPPATVRVTPTVAVSGSAPGAPFAAVGAGTPLAFALDATALRPSGPSPTAAAPVATVPVPVRRPHVLSVAGHHITVTTARSLAGGAAALALLGAIGAGALARRRAGDPAAALLRSYRDRVLTVENLPVAGVLIDVASVAALARVADTYDRLILHLPGLTQHVFAVHDGATTYRHVVPVQHEGLRRAPAGRVLASPRD
ncbi:MAG TPA: signal peptidase I [Frankiaceae bacterium]